MSTNSEIAEQSSYASLMVPVHLGPNAQPAIRVAASLAERFSSRLIGIAAEQIQIRYYDDSIAVIDDVLVEEASAAAKKDIVKAEALFRRTAGTSNAVEWRAELADPRSFALSQARAADLVVIGRYGALDPRQGSMAVSPGDLVMDLGRPILLVPPQAEALRAKRIIIAWRDTREARRAVWDALPFLKRAERVEVVSVGSHADENGAADVCRYLAEHQVVARATVRASSVTSDAGEILYLANQEDADLIVAGAYGHSRMREWLFGGTTKELLDTTPVCCLLSH